MRCLKTDPLLGRKATHWLTLSSGFYGRVGDVEVDLPFGGRLLQDTFADGRRRLPVDGVEIHAESMACHALLQSGDVMLGDGSILCHLLASRRCLRACLSIFPMGRRGSSRSISKVLGTL